MTTTNAIYFTASSFDPASPAGTFFQTLDAHVVSSTGTEEITIITIAVDIDVEDAAAAAQAMLDADPRGRLWVNLMKHTFEEVAELWVRMTMNDIRGVRAYKIGEKVTEWHDTTLRGLAVMTRRDDVKPGDIVYSSAGYYFEVGQVSSRGLMATIVSADNRNHSEIYDRDSLIPVML